MTYAFEITNPYEVPDVMDYFTAPDGLTVRELLERMTPGFKEFEFPTICLVNSIPWKREGWNNKLPPGAHVAFVRLAGTWEWIIVYLVIIIISIVLALVLTPSATAQANELQNGDPVYTLSGQRNQIRLNDPIESAYGRNRMFPSYAARPYNVYRGNNQFQYSLYCFGQGHHAIEELRFEDTPIEQFEDVEFQIILPGEEVTLFADNVDTSTAVNNVELFGPNEKEYTGWSGPFTTNAPGTLCNRIEVDVSLPQGLYATDEDGDIIVQAVEVSFQYREITDPNLPVPDWIPLVFGEKRIVKTPAGYSNGRYYSATTYETIEVPNFYKRLASVTPQRFTLGKDVPPGRYEIRAARINNKNKNRSSMSVVKWESLRAFFPSIKNYGAVTLVAIAARATNNLNNNAAQKFNGISTRMLPTWSPVSGWSDLLATRNPVWAFCDVFTARYGGRLPDTFLDLEELHDLSLYFELHRTYFDHIFDQKSTIWEAAKVVARVGRAIPMLVGSRLTMVRDEPKTVATAVFSMHNIIQGSFTWNITLVPVEDYNAVEIQYVDSETWTEESVICRIDDDEGTNPQTIRLPGCTDRRRAFEEGLYIRATQKFIRENIEFDTGLEGHLPRYGDLILVNHDVPRWGTSGLVLELAGAVVTLSQGVTFTPDTEHRIVLRKKDGSAFGPYAVTPGPFPHIVILDQAPDPDDFLFDDFREKPYFIFGVANSVAKRCIVVGVTPKNEDVVTIKAAAYVEKIFTYFNLPVPPKNEEAQSVTDPARPIVRDLKVMALPGTQEFIIVSWTPTLGAKTYVLEQSEDGINWSRAMTLPSTVAEIRVNPSQLHLRVAGVNIDYGPWITWSGRVGDVTSPPGTVLSPRVHARENTFVTITWNALVSADSYLITVYEKSSNRLLRQFATATLFSTYTWDMALADGLVGSDITFGVVGTNILGNSETEAILNTYINAPAPSQIEYGTATADNALYTADNSLLTVDKI